MKARTITFVKKKRVHLALELAQNRHRNLCAQWVLGRFPRNPVVTVQELGQVGAWCVKTLKQILTKIEHGGREKGKGDACH